MSPPEINVDQLMHQIRQAVAHRALENGRKDELSAGTLPDGVSAFGQIDAPELVLQPLFHASPTNEYHANDLLKYHGETFVRNAYQAILLREPDSAGAAHYLSCLAAGHFNKIDVLASLRYSAEGEQAGVEISGLAWPATVRKIERIPIVGYLLQAVIALARLPVLLRHQRQHEFYTLSRQEQMVDYVNRIDQRVAHNASEISACASTIETEIRILQNEIAASSARLGNLEARTAAVAAQLNETAETLNASLHKGKSELRAELEKLTSEQQQLVADLGLQERRLSDLSELGEIKSGLNEEEMDQLYVAFENQFRGEPEEIKNRLRVYLPVLADGNVTSEVVDIACGRGEWLELLRDNGIQARGVDHNRCFIESCKQLGLDVVHRDAIAYLRHLPEASLNSITSFHLVEHLPFKILMQLLDEMVRVLRPGSPLILETPNPENIIVGSHTFYSDPTHRHPIPSGTLRFLLESRGLTRIDVMNLRPWDAARIAGDDELTKRFNEYFYGPPDYGIVGWKSGSR